jgi:hypothetical protein
LPQESQSKLDRTWIRKLKGEKKSQQETLRKLTSKESLIDKETMTDPIEVEKSSTVKTQVVEKGTNIDPIHVTTQEGAKSVEVRTFSDVGVQTMEIQV